MNYSYKEEMIGDAIENCIQYIRSFNPEKSTNPFSYFTQVVWHAFIHRIQKEKKQQYIKYKAMDNMIINNQHFIHGADEAFHAITPEVHENTQRFISTFEDNIEKNKKKKEKKALENFIED
jgi:DNA-directed RNA polymerase specialized sigma24 family protein